MNASDNKIRNLWPRILGTALADKIDSVVKDLFPERQVYFRSKGVVRFVSLSPRFQGISIALAFVATCWMGVASANLIFGSDVVEAKDRQIASLKDTQAELLLRVEVLKSGVVARAKSVEERQEYINQLIKRIELPDDDPSQATTFGDETNEIAQPIPAEDHKPLPVGGPEAFLIDVPFVPVNVDRSLLDKIEAVERKQVAFVQMVNSYTVKAANELENAISSTGLKTEDVVSSSMSSIGGQGGPLQPLGDITVFRPDSRDWLTELVRNTERLATLKKTLAGMPLAKPVGYYYISSRYGRRKDPFRKTWAFHGGLDMAGHWKTPVRATAAGTITFVGRNGAYGKMVEIDHQNGFKTRYGHLATILVDMGQQVGLTNDIGLMGNSGRSTGTHLHYEIRFDEKVLNPSKFFKVAKNVQAK